MNKIIRSLCLGAAITLTAAPASAEQFINVLTGGASGVYYPLGVGLSKIWGEAVPGSRTSVQSTKASVENLNLLQTKRGEAAFTLGDSFSQAWAGNQEAGFKAPLKKLRAISALYPNYVQLVASADSGIKTLTDLKGKRVSVGAAKSGTELNARAILGAAGIEYSDLGKVEYLPFSESVELMKNRQIDATLQSVGLGAASIRDLATSIDIVLVSVPADVVAAVGDSAYEAAEIPAGTYKGQDAAVPAVAVRNFLATHEDVPEDVVYAMTKSMYANLDSLVAAHTAAKSIKLENAAKTPAPLHPGAARYYREAGVLK